MALRRILYVFLINMLSMWLIAILAITLSQSPTSTFPLTIGHTLIIFLVSTVITSASCFLMGLRELGMLSLISNRVPSLSRPTLKLKREVQKVEEVDEDSCPYYFGYLHKNKGRDGVDIPSQCFNCRRLVQCAYSPVAISSVYEQ